MKNFLKILIFLSIQLAFDNSIIGQSGKQISTLAELKKIAAQFGVDELVGENTNKYLQFMPKADVETFFKKQAALKREPADLKLYFEATKSIKTAQDYVNLVNKYPVIKNSLISAIGSEQKFGEYCNFILKEPQKIYRHENGTIELVIDSYKESPEEAAKRGARLDNLPRQ